MAGVIELAPWTSMSAGASNDITQPLREWADALSYADGVFWIDVKSKSGAPTLHIQTAAVAEDGYFQDFVDPVSAEGIAMKITRFASATTPMMRYLRWKIEAGASSWSLTFRVMAALKNR